MAVWKLPKLPSGRERNKPYRAKVKTRIKDFLTRKDAEYWERCQLQSYTLTGLPLTVEALERQTVGDLVARYLKEKTPLKGGAESEEYFLKRFQQHPMCKLTLAAVRKADAYNYKNERQLETWNGKPISQGTVKRQIGILHNIFEVAKQEWGFENLTNPFDRMKLKDGPGRERPARPGELERIIGACKTCRAANRYYMPLAIYLAIETAMRQQEIFNLLWSDIDMDNRRIVIRKSKTDHLSELRGRTIVLTLNAMWYLERLAKLSFGLPHEVLRKVPTGEQTNFYWRAISAKNERVFPMTKGAFKQAWRDAVQVRAGIRDLQFRDLRHWAASWLDAAKLTASEHDLMMGHGKRTMRARYIHADLEAIQDKLDRYVLDGMTPKQELEKYKATPKALRKIRTFVLAKGMGQDLKALFDSRTWPSAPDPKPLE
jgi:integrase